jgi:uncharacterized protein YjgD (DUF1641 family)
MDQAMVELNQKIDLLAGQVAYLTQQAQMAERSRESTAELVETVMPIARDAMSMASEQMQEVQEYLELDDLLRLLKKLVRHAPQFEMLLDQLDSVLDLVDTAGPIVRQGMDFATEQLDGLEKKGYLGFTRSGLRMVDQIVTSFTEEDVDRLGDNIVLMLNTVKDLTQPEILTFVRNTLQVAEVEVQKPVNTGYLALLSQLRDPVVRRGLALTLRVLRVVGEQAAPAK